MMNVLRRMFVGFSSSSCDMMTLKKALSASAKRRRLLSPAIQAPQITS